MCVCVCACVCVCVRACVRVCVCVCWSEALSWTSPTAVGLLIIFLPVSGSSPPQRLGLPAPPGEIESIKCSFVDRRPALPQD